MIGYTQHSERLARSSYRVVWIVAAMCAAFFLWAWNFSLVEVSSGPGTVVPSAHEQVIQSLDGGILSSLEVREGDTVEAGQLLAKLDPTRTKSNVEEAAAKYYSAIATAARLRAEISGADHVTFSAALDGHDALKESEQALFEFHRRSLTEALSGLVDEQNLIRKELEITQRLQSSGAASKVELIRLQREDVKTGLDISKLKADTKIQAAEELQKVSAEAEVNASIMRGRSDQLARLTIRAPMRGIVQDIAVTTIGGVIPPNGQLMTIVPLDDKLLIEAKISPRDIAYIHPGQDAMVKISAYDYSIFGGLAGKVVTISPNTVKDEAKPDIVYYRVYIQTDRDYLENKAGQKFSISPGMVGTVDIRTGEKTVWQYLVKPFNKAHEALRER